MLLFYILHKMYDTIVIGAGASGMMATIAAAEKGRHVLLIEKMDQPGRKLRITGKGRCNLTNTAPLKDFLTHVGSDARFLRNCMSQFYNQELMHFFEQRNVPLVTERGSRVFPASGKSLDIFLALINDIEKRDNVEIRRNCTVRHIDTTDDADGRHASAIRLADGTRIAAQRIIVATGGQSYPTTGSTGAGYTWAQELGHTVSERVPSLTALRSQEPIDQDLIGFVIKNVVLSLYDNNNRKIFEQQGEMTFCNDGLWGPLVLSASRIATRRLHNGETLTAHIDLKPAIDQQQLDQRLINDLNANGTRIFNDALRLWLPAELIPTALRRLHIEYYKRLNQINGNERKRLLQLLKSLTYTIIGTHDFDDAITTQGGVNLKEVNPKTMESKIIKGLYFTGEVLDLDADTGGYNLQIAFSTGWAAGMAE